MKKIPISGGVPVPVAKGPLGGFNWRADDTIVYAQREGVMRSKQIFRSDKQIRSAQILPGGKSVLFSEGPFDYFTLFSI